MNSVSRRNIEFLEGIQKQYEHPERFTLPLPTSVLLELIGSGSAGITLPGSGHLWLTIVALPPAPAIATVAEFSKSGGGNEEV